ncbi:homocysteine S-methyltransferase family protein [Algoriella sp.]|uniref:homocysteine S-methyltransferase family protein n=2 Tax=Algoriella sp. TaxID=1872434 RepID=UPI002FCAC1D5
MKLDDILKERIVILDGAMGTMIQKHNLQEEDYRGERFKDFHTSLKGNNDLLVLTQPEIIKNIHREYLAAGADLIETNTFNANIISMVDYDMVDLVDELNYEAVRLAREAVEEFSTPEKPRFVVGSLGPTNKTASISPQVNDPSYRDVDFDTLAKVYYSQAKTMLEAGVDALLVETIFDTLNAKAAFFGIQDAIEDTGINVPLLASGTITDKSGRTLSGQTTEAFLISLEHLDLLSVGLNCALGATDLIPYLEVLAEKAPFYVSAYPNAGLPNAFGGYDETAEMMRDYVRPFLEKKLVNIIGGCCGTTPDHIRLMAELAKEYEPRKINA